MKGRIVLAVASCLIAFSALAEVRVARDRPGTLRLDVKPVATGVWTPVREPAPGMVNPQGDLLGDGYPVGAVGASGTLLAAWTRGADDSVVMLRASAPGAHSLSALASAEASGVPVVTAVGSRWLVAWTASSPEPSVKVTLATLDSDGTPATALPGRLVAVIPVGDAVHVLSHVASTGELLVATYAGLIGFPEPIPVPISITPIDLRLNLHDPDPIPVPISLRPVELCVERGVVEALVAWRARDHQVGSFMLDDLGVVATPAFRRGPSGSCTALLNAARR